MTIDQIGIIWKRWRVASYLTGSSAHLKSAGSVSPEAKGYYCLDIKLTDSRHLKIDKARFKMAHKLQLNNLPSITTPPSLINRFQLYLGLYLGTIP